MEFLDASLVVNSTRDSVADEATTTYDLTNEKAEHDFHSDQRVQPGLLKNIEKKNKD
jgi:hypothetical protein